MAMYNNSNVIRMQIQMTQNKERSDYVLRHPRGCGDPESHPLEVEVQEIFFWRFHLQNYVNNFTISL